MMEFDEEDYDLHTENKGKKLKLRRLARNVDDEEGDNENVDNTNISH
jgi:hypothetical protein